MIRFCLAWTIFGTLAACAWGQIRDEEWDPAGKPLPELIAAIRQPAYAFDRPRAAEAAAKFGRNAVEPLCELLQEEQEVVRSYALLALSRMGPEAEAAIPAVERIAADPQNGLRRQAIDVLGKIGQAANEVVPTLVKILNDVQDEHQQVALRSLATIGSVEALRAIEDSFQNGGIPFRRDALQTLREAPEAAENLLPFLVATYSRRNSSLDSDMLALMVAIGEPSVGPLVELLRAEQVESRRKAALALGQRRLTSAAAVPALTKALTDPEPVVRFWAVKALGAIGQPARTAADPLISCLNDADADVRWQTIRSIEQLGLQSQATEKLKSLRADPHPAVRQAAEQLLQPLDPSPQ
ncbi:MAG: HEAT repeat domain-containing protein [Pirellulaceae bacterium]|nr:HEAT repeat domain-containing protein [Pirellulaceae bacterium]